MIMGHLQLSIDKNENKYNKFETFSFGIYFLFLVPDRFEGDDKG